jgi:IclR family KDG regulon transcriptional repressor
MPIIQALDRALKILELFDEHTTELKITEISSRMELHKSTVHSLLKTLKLHGYIDQDEESGKYQLGLKFLERGQLLLQGMDIRGVSRRYLQSLSAQTGQTVHLVIFDGKDGVYIDKVEGEKAAIRYSRIGRRVHLHSSAVGKALIAFREQEEINKILQDYRFTKHTDRTIYNMESFMQELKQVRMQQFAMDNEENEPGVRCAAAPIFDHSGQVTAAISISTMVAHVNDREMTELIALLRKVTAEISRQMGYLDKWDSQII